MKLYVVVAAALSNGLKAAQACHAMAAFGIHYPVLYRYWYEEHNNIVILQDEDVPSLAERLEKEGIRIARFHEPDLGNQLTAICVEPSASRKLSSLPLVR